MRRSRPDRQRGRTGRERRSSIDPFMCPSCPYDARPACPYQEGQRLTHPRRGDQFTPSQGPRRSTLPPPGNSGLGRSQLCFQAPQNSRGLKTVVLTGFALGGPSHSVRRPKTANTVRLVRPPEQTTREQPCTRVTSAGATYTRVTLASGRKGDRILHACNSATPEKGRDAGAAFRGPPGGELAVTPEGGRQGAATRTS